MQSLQSEIAVMNQASQKLMADAGAESKKLMRQTMADLNDRLQTLETQARERELELVQKNSSWKQYQVRLERWSRM